jgi:hypothetical protein
MDLDGYQASFAKLWGYTNVCRLGVEHLAPRGNVVLVSGAPARKAKTGQIALASVGAAVEQFARTLGKDFVSMRFCFPRCFWFFFGVFGFYSSMRYSISMRYSLVFVFVAGSFFLLPRCVTHSFLVFVWHFFSAWPTLVFFSIGPHAHVYSPRNGTTKN